MLLIDSAKLKNCIKNYKDEHDIRRIVAAYNRIGKEIDVSGDTVRKWAYYGVQPNTKRDPNIIEKLAKVLGVLVDEITFAKGKSDKTIYGNSTEELEEGSFKMVFNKEIIKEIFKKVVDLLEDIREGQKNIIFSDVFREVRKSRLEIPVDLYYDLIALLLGYIFPLTESASVRNFLKSIDIIHDDEGHPIDIEYANCDETYLSIISTISDAKIYSFSEVYNSTIDYPELLIDDICNTMFELECSNGSIESLEPRLADEAYAYLTTMVGKYIFD